MTIRAVRVFVEYSVRFFQPAERRRPARNRARRNQQSTLDSDLAMNGTGSSRSSAPGVSAISLIYSAHARVTTLREESMDIEHGHGRVLDHLPVAKLLSAPHQELPVQPPLAMHGVEQPVRVLALEVRIVDSCRQEKGESLTTAVGVALHHLLPPPPTLRPLSAPGAELQNFSHASSSKLIDRIKHPVETADLEMRSMHHRLWQSSTSC